MVFIPPAFNDIGKAAKDLFNKGFYLGEVKVEHKSKTRSGLDFTASGTLPRDSDRMTGSLETKYALKQYGTTLTTKLNSDANVTFTTDIEDKLLKGLKITEDVTLDVNNNKHTAKFKADYKRNMVHYNLDADIWPLLGSKPTQTITSSLVLGYNGYLAGAQLGIVPGETLPKKHALALGWQNSDLGVHATLTNGEEATGYFWQKISPALEYALQIKFNQKKAATNFSAGVKYALDSDNSVKATLNSEQLIQFSFAHNLRHGIKLTLSTAISARLLWGAAGAASPAGVPQHRVGLGLEFDTA
jgi:voltage-dependent anion channel protein 2